MKSWVKLSVEGSYPLHFAVVVNMKPFNVASSSPSSTVLWWDKREDKSCLRLGKDHRAFKLTTLINIKRQVLRSPCNAHSDCVWLCTVTAHPLKQLKLRCLSTSSMLLQVRSHTDWQEGRRGNADRTRPVTSSCSHWGQGGAGTAREGNVIYEKP